MAHWAERFLLEQRVSVAPGSAFGAGGEGWIRVCAAASRETLLEGLSRLPQPAAGGEFQAGRCRPHDGLIGPQARSASAKGRTASAPASPQEARGDGGGPAAVRGVVDEQHGSAGLGEDGPQVVGHAERRPDGGEPGEARAAALRGRRRRRFERAPAGAVARSRTAPFAVEATSSGRACGDMATRPRPSAGPVPLADATAALTTPRGTSWSGAPGASSRRRVPPQPRSVSRAMARPSSGRSPTAMLPRTGRPRESAPVGHCLRASMAHADPLQRRSRGAGGVGGHVGREPGPGAAVAAPAGLGGGVVEVVLQVLHPAALGPGGLRLVADHRLLLGAPGGGDALVALGVVRPGLPGRHPAALDALHGAVHVDHLEQELEAGALDVDQRLERGCGQRAPGRARGGRPTPSTGWA